VPDVAVFEVAPYERKELSAWRSGNESLQLLTERLTPETAHLAEQAEIVSVFVHSRVGADTLAKLPRLRMIATRSTGFDHIDLGACRDRGVAVANVPAYADRAVAEHAFALLFAVNRNLREAARQQETMRFDVPALLGRELGGKVFGAVGAGRIGIQTLAADPAQNWDLARSEGFTYVPLHDLLGQADVVSLHAPLTPATRHLLDWRALCLMKPTAILINTARGGIVDTSALLRALEERRIAGAGFDVVEGEEWLFDEADSVRKGPSWDLACELEVCHSLLERPDVVYTPHVAFLSHESIDRLVALTRSNIQGFLSGTSYSAVLPSPTAIG